MEKAIEAFQGNQSEVRGVTCDVRNYAEVERAADMTVEAFGKVHVVCNNAGVTGTALPTTFRCKIGSGSSTSI